VVFDLTGRLEDAQLWAFITPRLSDLGLEPGPIELGGPAACPIQKAITPISTWSLVSERWDSSELGVLPEAIREARLVTSACAVRPACLEVVVTSLPFVTDGRPLWALSAGDDVGLLMGTVAMGAGPGVFLVEPRRVAVPLTLDPPEARLSAAWRARDGGLWFAGYRGEIFRGELDAAGAVLRLSQEAALPNPAFLAAFVDSSTGADDLLTLSQRGELGRLRLERGWTQVGTLNGEAGVRAISGGMVPLGAEDTLVVWGYEPRMLRYRGRALEDVTPAGFEDTATAVADLGPELGIFALMGPSGRLMRWVDEQWSVDASAELGETGYGVAAMGGEIFVGGSSGRLSQVRRGGGMCPLPMLDLGTIRLVSSFGGGIIAVRGDPSPTIEKTIYFIDPH